MCDWVLVSGKYCLLVEATNHWLDEKAAQGFATEEDYRTDTEDTFVNKKPSSIRSKCIPASSASRRAVPRRARACSVFAGGRRPLAHGSGHGVAAWMRCGDGGLRSSRKAGRIGRGHRLPPQLGHIPIKWPSTQRRQKVHS